MSGVSVVARSGFRARCDDQDPSGDAWGGFVVAGFEMDPSGNPKVFRGVPRLSFPPIGSPLAQTRDPTVKAIGENAAPTVPSKPQVHGVTLAQWHQGGRGWRRGE